MWLGAQQALLRSWQPSLMLWRDNENDRLPGVDHETPRLQVDGDLINDRSRTVDQPRLAHVLFGSVACEHTVAHMGHTWNEVDLCAGE